VARRHQLVKPDTLLRWHRDLFTLFWRRRSRRMQWSRGLGVQVVELIRTMANALWGAERIRGELLKLGLRVISNGRDRDRAHTISNAASKRGG
jgi:hypothetical protein